MTFLTAQSDVAALVASDGRHSGHGIPAESGSSGVPAAGTDVGDNVDVAEEGTTTPAETATTRPWRPRGVRAGRRLKKRQGVSVGLLSPPETSQSVHSQYPTILGIAAET